jgi:threonine 3-dehydrogenase
MRCLVTGAGGQVGSELLAVLAKRGDEVVATDIAEVALPAGVSFRRLDVTDGAAVNGLVAEAKPEVVFHLAAILSAKGERSPELCYAVNQTGTYHILEACRLARVPRLVYTSSIAAFGPGVPDPTPDDVPLAPTTLYGVTKVSGELLGGWYHHRGHVDFRGVRFPGLLAATRPSGGTSDYALFMLIESVRGEPYDAFCRPDTRIPFMHIDDGVRALVEIGDAPAGLSRRMYNIAAFSPTAQEIADEIKKRIPGARLGFKPEPPRQAILDSWPRRLDDAAARKDWGWRNQLDLGGALDSLISEIKEKIAYPPL